jgi:hypothetical protein
MIGNSIVRGVEKMRLVLWHGAVFCDSGLQSGGFTGQSSQFFPTAISLSLEARCAS